MSIDAPSLPPHWALVTMGDIADVVGGSTPKSKEPSYWNGDIPWLAVSDLTGYTNQYIAGGARSITQEGYASCATQMVPEGTVLFSSRAPIGYVAIAAQPLCTSQGFKSFVLAPSVSAEYVYWYLRYAKPLAESRASGTTFRELSGKAAAALPIPLPPRGEQDRIVARIEALFAEVANGEQGLAVAAASTPVLQASTLQHAIWRGPANTGQDGASISEAFAKQRHEAWKHRLAEGAARGQYKEPLPVDGCPEVPEGWALLSVDQVCEFVTDGDHNPPKRQPDGVPHLTAKNVLSGRLDFSDVTFISPEDFVRVRQRYQPAPDDVVVTCVGTIGRVAVVPDGCVFSPDRNLAGLRPLPGILPQYLAAVMETPQLQVLMRDASGSTAQPHLYLGDLRRLPVPIPPLEVQELIVAGLRERMKQVRDGETLLARARFGAAQLRTAVLRDAFTGVLAEPDTSDVAVADLLEIVGSELVTRRAEMGSRKKRRAPALVR